MFWKEQKGNNVWPRQADLIVRENTNEEYVLLSLYQSSSVDKTKYEAVWHTSCQTERFQVNADSIEEAERICLMLACEQVRSIVKDYLLLSMDIGLIGDVEQTVRSLTVSKPKPKAKEKENSYGRF